MMVEQHRELAERAARHAMTALVVNLNNRFFSNLAQKVGVNLAEEMKPLERKSRSHIRAATKLLNAIPPDAIQELMANYQPL